MRTGAFARERFSSVCRHLTHSLYALARPVEEAEAQAALQRLLLQQQ